MSVKLDWNAATALTYALSPIASLRPWQSGVATASLKYSSRAKNVCQPLAFKKQRFAFHSCFMSIFSQPCSMPSPVSHRGGEVASPPSPWEGAEVPSAHQRPQKEGLPLCCARIFG